MAKLIRFPQVDERPTPPPPLQVDDGSEAWWAGVQRCFIAIPIAATIAATLLSSKLSWGYQQQTEDIVPLVVTVAEDEHWHRPIWITPRITVSGPTWDDQVRASPQLEDEYWWRHQSRTNVVALWLPPDDQIPAGSLHSPFEDDAWQVYTPPYKPLRFLHLPDPEEIPAGSLFGVPEESEWSLLVPRRDYRVPWLPSIDEEIVPQPVVFSPDEDTWLVFPLQSERLAAWLPSADEEIVPQPAAIVEETDWQHPFCITRPIRVSGPTWDDQVRASPQVEDDPWLGSLSLLARPRIWLPVDDGQGVPIIVISDDAVWVVRAPKLGQSVIWLPDANDEIIPQPVFGLSDDDHWFVWTIRRAGVVLYELWQDGGDLSIPRAQQAIRSFDLDPHQPPRQDISQPARHDDRGPTRTDIAQPGRHDPRQPRRG